MSKTKLEASTLPELLVTMLLAGIVLLIAFDGLNMLQVALRQPDVLENGTDDLLRLQHHEILMETTDSVSVRDSMRYYKGGIVVETLERWDKRN